MSRNLRRCSGVSRFLKRHSETVGLRSDRQVPSKRLSVFGLCAGMSWCARSRLTVILGQSGLSKDKCFVWTIHGRLLVARAGDVNEVFQIFPCCRGNRQFETGFDGRLRGRMQRQTGLVVRQRQNMNPDRLEKWVWFPE